MHKPTYCSQQTVFNVSGLVCEGQQNMTYNFVSWLLEIDRIKKPLASYCQFSVHTFYHLTFHHSDLFGQDINKIVFRFKEYIVI